MLTGRRIVLGVSGGIAAYKAIEVCRRLVDAGAHVTPVLTNGAQRFVGATTFSALASERARTSLFDDDDPIPHTTLGQQADLILVCPATARVLGSYAAGISNDLLTATLLATRAPVVVCPAMHTEMWEHAAVQENLATLVRRGVHIVPPEQGRLAGGDMGKGRLAEPETVVEVVEAILGGDSAPPASTRPLSGLRVVVSAGGTREPIDPVRVITNRSSGKQGHAIATEAVAQGALVTLVTTVPATAPPGVQVVPVETAAEMETAVLEASSGADVVIMAAAVADFRPKRSAEQKLKKADGLPEIVLEPTPDILAELGRRKVPGQVLVGFAAETTDVVANARRKLEAKGADLIVANDVSAPGEGFQHDTNRVVLVTAEGDQHGERTSKREVARHILAAVLALRAAD